MSIENEWWSLTIGPVNEAQPNRTYLVRLSDLRVLLDTAGYALAEYQCDENQSAMKLAKDILDHLPT